MFDSYRGNISENFTNLGFAAHLKHGYLPIRPEDCSYVWQIPPQDRCQWVRNTKNCYENSLLQYTQILFCNFHSDNIFLFCFGLFLAIVWLIYLFLILGTTADNFFCPSLAVMASVLRLSESIAGVTILAFGNGAPDIFTSIVSGVENEAIMFTELLGAGIFVTTMIAGSVAFVSPFRVRLNPLMRDSCFYIFCVCWIAFVVKDETIRLWEALSFILCYAVFIIVVVIMQIQENREEKLKTRIPSASDPDILRAYLANKDPASIPTVPTKTRATGLQAKLDVAIATELEREKFRHRVSLNKQPASDSTDDERSTRPKGLFKEFLYDINPIGIEDWTNASVIERFILIIRSPCMLLLQLFVPLVNTTCEKNAWSKLLNCFQLCVTPALSLFLLKIWDASIGPVPIIALVLFIGVACGVTAFIITQEDREPSFHNVFAFLGFLTAMLVVYFIAQEVVAVIQCIGYACSLSDAMLGITFLAWGNSIGDLIANIAIAKRGYPRMGYAACFGGPMFNTLLGLGITYALASSQMPSNCTTVVMSDMTPGCMAFLLCSLMVTIIYMNITNSVARKSYAYVLYSVYTSFILVQFLSEFNVIHPLGIDYRPSPNESFC